MRKLKIVFMGTPEFAVPSLRILIEQGYEVVGVVTATDKPGGRGRREMLETPVKRFALSHGLPVLQPEKLRDPQFLEALHQTGANLFVVVAFRMLPKSVWSMPEYGTFNLHGSLLPRYRGAAPINWAIIRGESVTGVTSFFIREEIDTGNILFQEPIEIGPDETAGELHDRMMHLGAAVVLKTVEAIAHGPVTAFPQDETLASQAPKIFHETCAIDFNQNARDVHNFIRGMSPYPGAYTSIEGQTLKILRCMPEEQPHPYPPGYFFSNKKNIFKISTLDGFVHLLELQLEGRRRMDVKSFLNGFSFEDFIGVKIISE
jgi:methionyl-tRNA formyltransferase